MKYLKLVAKAEIKESLHTKWFALYSLVFGGAVLALYWTGITESQIMGLMGISRLLLTYFQLCIVVLPIFILITTVRSMVGDKESNLLEYMLSMPLAFKDYFWGKLAGRFSVVMIPIIGAMVIAALWAQIKGAEVEWVVMGLYCLLLISMVWFFLGLSMLIFSLVQRQETGLSMAFFAWLFLILFIDIILIGVFLQYQIHPELVISIALINPLQDFRTASMSLFDQEFTMLGPSSWFILEHFGKVGFRIFSILYPIVAGSAMAYLGYKIFSKKDVV
ncbi:MAG: ABC transporter permease subunit [Dissulfurispiraceae bacterium]|jgi:ABC-2 type transport system permease protein|nr:ABC transporter permease subunit [Dissulfurispiraceae bacterium]